MQCLGRKAAFSALIGRALGQYQADVFFDDQQSHCESASRHVATGHVPHGVANNDVSNS